MRTVTSALLVIALALTVFVVRQQESDIQHLKGWCAYNEGGLMSLHGGLASLEGGLARDGGGLDLVHARSAVAKLRVSGETVVLNPVFGLITKEATFIGTGVFVSDNIILTAKHVVEDRKELSDVTITNEAGDAFTVVDIWEDADDDLAVIEVAETSATWLETCEAPSLGDVLIGVGHQNLGISQELIIYWTRVSREKYGSQFLYDGFAYNGNSGGPLIYKGKLAGIARAKRVGTCGLGYAVPLNRLDPDLRARF